MNVTQNLHMTVFYTSLPQKSISIHCIDFRNKTFNNVENQMEKKSPFDNRYH